MPAKHVGGVQVGGAILNVYVSVDIYIQARSHMCTCSSLDRK